MKKIIHSFAAISRLKKWLLGLFVVFSLAIFSLSAIVATQGGSRWLVSQAAHVAGVRLGAVNGNLLTGLDIASLDFGKDAVQIHAEKIMFRWQPLALFYTSVSVQSISAENITVHLPAAAEKAKPESEAWPSLAQPLRITLDNILLRNINIQQGEQKLALDTISGSLSLGTFHLRANNFVVSNPQFTLSTTGSMGLRYPYAIAVKSHWSLFAGQDAKWEGEASIGGDIKKLLLTHNLQQPLRLITTGSVAPALRDKKQKPSMQLNSEWSEQDIPTIFMQNAAAQKNIPFLKSLLTMRGRLQLQGWLDHYEIQGDLHSKTVQSEFSADVKVIGKYSAASAGHSPLIKWDIEKLRLKSQPLIASPSPDENSFLQLKGNIHLSPALKWDLLLEGEHVNLGQIFVDWPTDLQINVASQGEFTPRQNFSLANGRIAIKQLDIRGDVRGLKLLSSGALDFDGSHWRTSDISVALGANQLSLKGKAGNDIAVEWKINAPLLNQIDPSISGSIISSGVYTGAALAKNSAQQVAVQMTMEVNQFTWRNYAVANLTSSLTSSGNDQYQLTLNGENLELAQQRISRMSLTGKGNIAQHHFVGAVEMPSYGALDFKLESSWKDNQWRGQWQKLSVALKRIPLWSLTAPVTMQADKTHVDFNKLCLSPAPDGSADKQTAAAEQAATVCATLNWKADSGLTASLNAHGVPLRPASAWLKSEVALDGVVDAQLSLQAPKNTPAVGAVHLQSRDAQFVYQFRGGNVKVYPIKRGAVDITLKNNQLNALLEMDWGQYGIINGDAKYSVKDKKILGKIMASLPDLAPLESLLPTMDDVHGSAAANINIAGLITQPDVTGNITLSNGRATMPKAGLELKDISLDISSQTAGLVTLNGQILSGEGRLMLKGTLTNLGTEKWHCQGNIFGANISIIKQTQLSATISPNLTFSADAGAINLNGSTEIPWARADIKALPSSATRVSNDVVMVNTNDYPTLEAQRKNAIPIYTNVILYFGDDVKFKGFGLDGGLSGKINVFKEENRQMLTTGFVAVNQGIYQAYGQELTIERGRLIFQGPYDNPGLDIRAVRTIDAAAEREGFKVGLDIAGTLQQPKSTVFSIPSLDDHTAEMAFLLTGKPVSQLNAADAYTLISAVSGMGVEGGSKITDDIANFFRIDEFAIKEDKNLDQNALLIGKNITPRLMVRYVVGLLDQAFTLGMSYQITDRIRVDAESGKRQSVDVIYKIER